MKYDRRNSRNKERSQNKITKGKICVLGGVNQKFLKKKKKEKKRVKGK